jgi:hypothetical protein
VRNCQWRNARKGAASLRVVGYIREASADGEPAFAQSERIRRWINENGHRLIALCQDVRTPGHTVGREGLQSIVGIISAGQVDAVVIPSLQTLSPDKVSQEVILWDLRSHGVSVLSTDTGDLGQLADPPDDSLRLFIRDVLDKSDRFDSILRHEARDERQPSVVRIDDMPDVVIELIPADKGAAAPSKLANHGP